MTIQHAVVIGAGSAIGQAIVRKLAGLQGVKITAFTRNASALWQHPQVNYQATDHTVESLQQAQEDLQQYSPNIMSVFICLGTLHGNTYQPEKAISQLGTEGFNHVMHVNALLPLLWLKTLLPALKGGKECKISILSARVGSISDNQLGGWYSYRASKAALNMMLKSLAVELARSHKNIKLLTFHPGTTDTPLSKPFQQRVSQEKLFKPEFVANQLIALLETLPIDGKLSFMDWNHKKIRW